MANRIKNKNQQKKQAEHQEKHTKMIGHMHGYINNHQSHFIGPIKIDQNVKITPLGRWWS